MIREFTKADYAKLFDMRISKEDQEELVALTDINSVPAVLVASCLLSEKTFVVDGAWGGHFMVFGYTRQDNSVWLIVDERARLHPAVLLRCAHKFLTEILPENPPYFFYRNWVSINNTRAVNLLAHLGAHFSEIPRTSCLNKGLRLQEFSIYPGEVKRCAPPLPLQQ